MIEAVMIRAAIAAGYLLMCLVCGRMAGKLIVLGVTNIRAALNHGRSGT